MDGHTHTLYASTAHITIWKVAIDRYEQAQIAWHLNSIDVNPFRYEIPTNDDAHVYSQSELIERTNDWVQNRTKLKQSNIFKKQLRDKVVILLAYRQEADAVLNNNNDNNNNNNKVIYTAQIRQGRKCAFSRQFWRGKFSVYL